jgi:serine/threonine-protein kinase
MTASDLSSRYRSLFVLGRGGMGTVEAALEIDPDGQNDASAYRRVVALKRLLPDVAVDRRRTDMFLREARLAAMLDHPNVVRAFDYGQIDGELFLAMEYVEGQPLSRVLRTLADSSEKLTVELVAYALSEVCRGLHAAHELTDPATGSSLGVVHRDVSPQNVMLGYDGRVRLLDFGVAKIETENLTKTGEVKGKTAYMSPEQAMGDPIDRRSDLFGVGAILFECFALRRMWGDGTDMEVIRKLALENPPPLDEAGVEVPAGLERLYRRLVARERTERPATALDVATELDAFVGDRVHAAETLRTLLERHFGSEASARHARLTSSLESAAPDHVESLRESVTAHRTTVAPPAGTERASGRSRKAAALAIAGLGAALAIAWWTTADRPNPSYARAPLHVESAKPIVATSPPAPSPSLSTAPPPTPSTAPPPSRPQAKPTSSRSAAPAASSASRPSATPKPSDVDETPF